MTTVLHIIQQMSLGGAARATVAMAKFSGKIGEFHHRIVSLTEPRPEGWPLAKEAGVEILKECSIPSAIHEMKDADIVQIHWWNCDEMNRLLARELSPARILMWYHVNGFSPGQMITQAVAHFSRYNVLTNAISHKKLTNLFGERPPDLIIDPADFERLEGMAQKPHEGFNVGYIGTVDWAKMHRRFVPMSAAIDIPGIKFTVCGGGLDYELAKETETLGCKDRFVFAGYVHDIRPVLETLDVFGYPLCPDTYASGELCLQEAMWAGVPPVVFPYGGIQGIVIDDITGLIVRTEQAYKEAIEYLYHNTADRLRLGTNAARYARDFFGAGNAAPKINRLYQKMLRGPQETHRPIP